MGRLFPRKYFQSNSVLSKVSREIVKNGDTLTKLNLTSSGKMRKFIKVFNSSSLRWAKKESYLNNIKNCHSYLLSEIKGIVVGKVTSTFKKSKNANLESWLCLSIILKNRSLDLYIPEEKIDFWVIGLSEFCKQNNSKAFCLTKGQYLWRKAALIIKQFVHQKMVQSGEINIKDKNQTRWMSLCKAILHFNKFKQINPMASARCI